MPNAFDPASFRDPAGHVFIHEGRVYRSIRKPGIEAFRFTVQTGALKQLIDEGLVIGTSEAPANLPDGLTGDAELVVEHPKLPFVSYPYEWSFPMLKAAALHHLKTELEALKFDVQTIDASAYNIQFIGHRPVFIDVLSFVPYKDGDYWNGYAQFCEQFLYPLLLRAKLGVRHNQWYRGALTGIKAADIDALLPWHEKLSLNMLLHVKTAARAQGLIESDRARALERLRKAKERTLPKASRVELLSGLYRWIDRMGPAKRGATTWGEYASDNTYSAKSEESKRAFVRNFIEETRPRLLWDMGCNTGDYSELALRSGAGCAVGFDFDQNAIEAAYRRAVEKDLPFLPLVLDGMNPSPDQGWAEKERMGLESRGPADAVLALAVVHHLAIANNVPLDMALDWIVGLAPTGVIEWVPKEDPTVGIMLAARKDIFEDYSIENFEKAFKERAVVIKKAEITESGRTLFRYERRGA